MLVEHIDCVDVLDVECVDERLDAVEDLECMQAGDVDCVDV